MTAGIDLPDVPVPLSRLVLATMPFGDMVDRADAANTPAAALEAGITGVDTANGCASWTSERDLAGLLPAHRDRFMLATEAGMPRPGQGEHAALSTAGLRAAGRPGHSPAEAPAAVAESVAEGLTFATADCDPVHLEQTEPHHPTAARTPGATL